MILNTLMTRLKSLIVLRRSTGVSRYKLESTQKSLPNVLYQCFRYKFVSCNLSIVWSRWLLVENRVFIFISECFMLTVKNYFEIVLDAHLQSSLKQNNLCSWDKHVFSIFIRNKLNKFLSNVIVSFSSFVPSYSYTIYYLNRKKKKRQVEAELMPSGRIYVFYLLFQSCCYRNI